MHNPLITPTVTLPTLIDSAGTAAETVPLGGYRSFTVQPVDASSQLRVTLGGKDFDFPAGLGWSVQSPNGALFSAQDVILTSLAGQFVITKLQ